MVKYPYMSETNRKIVTRMAPSPTGLFHVGSVRTALYNYLFARQHGGKFILRIEDTDKERSKKEFEDNIIEAFKWLNLSYDEFYRQSERTDIYKKYIEKMIVDGFAYISKEEPKEEGQRSEVIRFKNPNKKVAFDDIVLGKIEVDTTDLGDFVIARDMESPLYHLTVVIDDHEMEVTHVIRGQDHITNTPRQILIQEAIGAIRPSYAHIPLILSPDKSKLSKRHGALGTTEYREFGYLPQAIINFMALIGWNPGTEQEIFNLEELIKVFNLGKVQKGGGVFNIEKLKWINKEHIKILPYEENVQTIRSYLPESISSLSGFTEEKFLKIIPLILERISTYADVKDMAEGGELAYFFARQDYPKEKIVWKDSEPETIKNHLRWILEILINLSEEEFTQEKVKEVIMSYADIQPARGVVLHPMRFALSGLDRSPDPFTLAFIFGKEETLARLSIAIEKLG